jgi:hypothetical protein
LFLFSSCFQLLWIVLFFNFYTSTATLELAVYFQNCSTSPYSRYSTIKSRMFKESPHTILQRSIYLIIHEGERTKTGWLGIRIMCPSGAACLSADCCFSQLALYKNPTQDYLISNLFSC